MNAFTEYDAIVERQRKEKKDLREKIIALKRAEKGSKKDKKKLQDEIGKSCACYQMFNDYKNDQITQSAQMEKDLMDKHADELAKLKLEDDNTAADETNEELSKSDDGLTRKSKAQKRRERKVLYFLYINTTDQVTYIN